MRLCELNVLAGSTSSQAIQFGPVKPQSSGSHGCQQVVRWSFQGRKDFMCSAVPGSTSAGHQRWNQEVLNHHDMPLLRRKLGCKWSPRVT